MKTWKDFRNYVDSEARREDVSTVNITFPLVENFDLRIRHHDQNIRADPKGSYWRYFARLDFNIEQRRVFCLEVTINFCRDKDDHAYWWWKPPETPPKPSLESIDVLFGAVRKPIPPKMGSLATFCETIEALRLSYVKIMVHPERDWFLKAWWECFDRSKPNMISIDPFRPPGYTEQFSMVPGKANPVHIKPSASEYEQMCQDYLRRFLPYPTQVSK